MNNSQDSLSDPILLSQRDAHGVVTLTLNRPDAFNALSEAMIRTLHEALNAIRDDSAVRAVVIAAGKVVADGTPMELESRSRYHQAVTLVAEGELDCAALAALPGVAGVEDNAEGSLTLLAAPGQVIFPQVNELIRQRGWQVKELDVERGRLDEVFRSLTRGEAA